jgi:hypothetical protein
MKNILFISAFLIGFAGCNTNDPDHSRITPAGAMEILNLQINGNRVTATTLHGTPNPCYYFYRKDTSRNDSMYTAKVYIRYDGEICIQVLGTITHEHVITFPTQGEKRLSFWQNDTTYIDTTIVIQ